jgi:DNA-damage-inducible protein D
MENSNIIPFEGKEIRKVWHEEQWYFSIVDVIEVLTDSPSPKTYWAKLKAKEQAASSQPFPFTEQLKMKAIDKRNRLTDCANTEGVLRIVMSVPSPKAEPLKLWLAQVGKERLEETENPEIGFERLREIYIAKGYPVEWIQQRIQNIDTRKQLTDEWKNRGVQQGQEYSNLTAIIAKGTFGLNPSEHKKLKGLEKPSQNLRDHMTTLELLFSTLGEETTRILASVDDAQGFEENREKAIKGGQAAGKSLNNYEKDTGIKVVSDKNYLKPLKGNTKENLIEDAESKE